MKRRQKREKQRRRVEARRDSARAVETPDHRSVYAEITAEDGVPVGPGRYALVVEPIRLGNGDVLMFQSPFVVPFYLLKAKELRNEAEPKRLRALKDTQRASDGNLRPLHPAVGFDALEDWRSR